VHYVSTFSGESGDCPDAGAGAMPNKTEKCRREVIVQEWRKSSQVVDGEYDGWVFRSAAAELFSFFQERKDQPLQGAFFNRQYPPAVRR